MKDLAAIQLELEKEMAQRGYDKVKKALEAGAGNTRAGRSLIAVCTRRLAKRVSDWVDYALSGKTNRRPAVAKIIRDMDHAMLAYVTVKTTVELTTGSEEARRSSIAVAVGTHIARAHNTETMVSKAPALWKSVVEPDIKRSTTHRRRAALLSSAMRYLERKGSFQPLVWDSATKVKVGLTLLEMLLAECPDVFELRRYRKTVSGKIREETIVKFTEEALRRYDRLIEKEAEGCPAYYPMVVKPQPWESLDSTPYITPTLDVPFVRTDRGHREILEGVDLDAVYRAVNAIQETPWRINKRVMDVLFYYLDHEITCPILAGDYTKEPPKRPAAGATPEEIKAYRRKAAEYHTEKHRAISKRSSALRQALFAKRFAGFERIYYPHSLDFRGRIYPVAGVGVVNPQGDDLSRGLLEFAEGKPLGEDGMKWLEIHLANCFGYDKISLIDRQLWTRLHHERIMAVADDPFEETWWHEADKPWMFLAAAFAYSDAHHGVAKCHLPVSVDGSCSGIQHYSAMLRDPVGARAVNLAPSETPQDIYAEVAEVASERMLQLAEEGNEIAAAWIGKVDRAVAKRPVMTLPYGATLQGMEDQILDHLKKKEIDLGVDRREAARLAARVIYGAIGKVVDRAVAAMEWLRRVANVAGKYGPITWETPSGFVARQDYRKQAEKRVVVWYEGQRIRVSLQEPSLKTDPRRHANALCPNLVHSLDASHLVLTVNHCLDAGINAFTMIHDSFGTHAADVENLNKILRETFVDMYSKYSLQKFIEDVAKGIPEEARGELPPPPEEGGFDLTTVRDSQFFFA